MMEKTLWRIKTRATGVGGPWRDGPIKYAESALVAMMCYGPIVKINLTESSGTIADPVVDSYGQWVGFAEPYLEGMTNERGL